MRKSRMCSPVHSFWPFTSSTVMEGPNTRTKSVSVNSRAKFNPHALSPCKPSRTSRRPRWTFLTQFHEAMGKSRAQFKWSSLASTTRAMALCLCISSALFCEEKIDKRWVCRRDYEGCLRLESMQVIIHYHMPVASERVAIGDSIDTGVLAVARWLEVRLFTIVAMLSGYPSRRKKRGAKFKIIC